jgi:hypothetical protein
MTPSAVRVGTTVATSDGTVLGKVAAVRRERFKVSAGGSEYWLPLSVVAVANAVEVRLMYPNASIEGYKSDVTAA